MGTTNAELAVERLAERQHGAVSRAQVLERGLRARRIRTLVDSGRWRRVAPGVYLFPGAPDTWERRLWVAHLHAGPESVVSHRSATRLERLGPIEGDPVDLLVPPGARAGIDGVRRFRVTDLEPQHVTTLRGLPVTRPARTIVDLASVVGATRLGAVVEHSVVERRCTIEQIATTLDDLRRHGKPGVRRLCDVLDELGPGEIPRSELERMLDAALALTDLPTPRHEYPLPSRVGMEGFVDRCWPEARLIVEADGRRWHTRRAQFARDQDRDLEAARSGYLTQRLAWERLQSDPSGTSEALAEIYQQRVELLRAESRRR